MPLTDDIVSISENVLGTMMQFDVSGTNLVDLPEHDQVTGCVQISGEWTGAVLLRTTMDFATQAAANLLALPREEVQPEDRQDAMAELANMIGGNVKSILPGPSYLSLPSVAIGKEFDFRLHGTTVVCQVPMLSAGEPFHVVVSQIAGADAGFAATTA